jgi:hypothetical protein
MKEFAKVNRLPTGTRCGEDAAVGRAGSILPLDAYHRENHLFATKKSDERTGENAKIQYVLVQNRNGFAFENPAVIMAGHDAEGSLLRLVGVLHGLAVDAFGQIRTDQHRIPAIVAGQRRLDLGPVKPVRHLKGRHSGRGGKAPEIRRHGRVCGFCGQRCGSNSGWIVDSHLVGPLLFEQVTIRGLSVHARRAIRRTPMADFERVCVTARCQPKFLSATFLIRTPTKWGAATDLGDGGRRVRNCSSAIVHNESQQALELYWIVDMDPTARC